MIMILYVILIFWDMFDVIMVVDSLKVWKCIERILREYKGKLGEYKKKKSFIMGKID